MLKKEFSALDSYQKIIKILEKQGQCGWKSPFRGWGIKRKGPRTWAPFTSHHPLPPKRSFKEKLIETVQMARYIH